MAELTKLKKFRTIPFIKGEDDTTWLRIGKSTIFSLAVNANVVTNDYIEDEAPTDEITYYKPTLPQELAAYKGDPAFDAIYKMFYNLPTGAEAKRDVLIVFDGNIASTTPNAEPTFNGWQVNATIVLTEFNTVDGKITFTLNLNGNINRCAVKITDGSPTIMA